MRPLGFGGILETMPRIAADSMVENRDQRHAALLEAAANIAQSEGIEAATVSAIAKRAGLARSSFYSYFNSAADVIADVLVDELDVMREMLVDRLKGLTNTTEIVRVWIDVSLGYVVDGRHAFVRAAAKVNLSPVRHAQLTAMHRDMMTPLVEALSRARVRQPSRTAQFISAAVDVCVRRIESGASADEEVSATVAFVLRGLSLHSD